MIALSSSSSKKPSWIPTTGFFLYFASKQAAAFAATPGAPPKKYIGQSYSTACTINSCIKSAPVTRSGKGVPNTSPAQRTPAPSATTKSALHKTFFKSLSSCARIIISALAVAII